MVNSNGRYNIGGEFGALYFSTSQRTVINELKGLTGGRHVYSLDVEIGNLLDLSNESVRAGLRIELDDIVRKTGYDEFDWSITQEIAKKARDGDFSGIIAPSAVSDGGLNVILFDNL